LSIKNPVEYKNELSVHDTAIPVRRLELREHEGSLCEIWHLCFEGRQYFCTVTEVLTAVIVCNVS
jgi:hypothetical protein